MIKWRSESSKAERHQIMTTRALLLLAITMLVALPHSAGAQVINPNQVGPQTFHKRIEIPNAIGSQTKFNNPDTFNGNTFDRQKVLKQRQMKQQRQNNRSRQQNTSSDERTQSQAVDTNRRSIRKNTTTRNQTQRSQQSGSAANNNSGND